MKKTLLVVSLLVCFTRFAVAQEAKQDPIPAPNPNAPEITFENDVHDYGTIKQGADGGCEFKFTNTGKEPLIISNAVGSCGCTVPTWPKEPILKGQSAVVQVHYDTKRVGAFTKNVTISSNAKSNTKVLTIKGTVEATEQVDQTVPFKKDNGATPLEIKSK
ncbi:MAG: DUF1573 domain-containing protein [Bacteroidia bacterium]|nr:DUF1573 domain-containing protein [Bacteroidia bacterium]